MTTPATHVGVARDARLAPGSPATDGNAGTASASEETNARALPLFASARQFDRNFWVYLGSYGLFWFAVYIFAELYPLYLGALEYGVIVLGNASVALNLGSIAGTIPAIFLMRGLGLTRTTVLALGGASLASAARLDHDHALMVYGGAFVAGFFFAVLAVGIAVIVSRLTTAANRALGFSWFFGVTIAAAFLGDALGGELPGMIVRMGGAVRTGDSILFAALLACAVGLGGCLGAVALRLPAPPPEDQRLRIPREPDVIRMMAGIALWNFAVGLFAPFYAVYFATFLGEAVRTIGLDLAGGQVVGVLFVVVAPAVIAARGAVPTARWIMFLAGGCALGLALVASTLAAAVGYAAYMGLVAMVQVPLQTLLMNRVRPDERSGASMLNALVGFAAVAVGGCIGGEAIAGFGFPPLLALAGAGSILASAAFLLLVKPAPAAEGEPVQADGRDA